jgi:prepilin-type N-terminal cleavage/methylation domain-containing protein
MCRGAAPSANRRVLRRGFTLVEVVLVLALLVIISAIALPVLVGSFSRASLYGGADLLRGAWARARLTAMQSGQTHVFRYEPDGRRYQITALGDIGLPENNQVVLANPDEEVEEDEQDERISRLQDRLPDGIIFFGGDISSSNQLLAMQPDVGQGPWSPPILFYPDGTTSDASLLLSNENDVKVRVTLRGLTGVASIVDVEDEVVP